jgi:hypothetical protein
VEYCSLLSLRIMALQLRRTVRSREKSFHSSGKFVVSTFQSTKVLVIFCSKFQHVDSFVCDYSAYKQFTWNLVGLIAITLWSGIFTGATFAVLYFMDVLR